MGDFTSIPILNLSLDRATVVSSLRDACENVGFFYLSNTGVSPDLIQRLFNVSKAYFELGLDKKNIGISDNFKGYTPLLGENVDPANNKGDLHEAFDIGSDKSGNRWPDETSIWGKDVGFKATLEEYWNEMISLGRKIFPLLALSLDLDEHYFDEMITDPACVMRILHYPPQPPATQDNEEVLGIGAHTDYECITILLTDPVAALEVRNRSGQWIQAPYIEGCVVVNLGDTLARWTNDKYVSTVHRAINRSGKQRYSVPFFYGANNDALIQTIPSCITQDCPKKYPDVKQGEYVQQRLSETYQNVLPS